MATRIEDPVKGELLFEKYWINDNGSIGKLANGTYAHFPNGNPITNPNILRQVIEEPNDLAQALEWWENRKVATPEIKVFIQQMPDGTYQWSDGREILEWQELLDYYSGNIPQDVAAWYIKENEKRMGVKAETTQEVLRAADMVSKRRKSTVTPEGERVITE